MLIVYFKICLSQKYFASAVYSLDDFFNYLWGELSTLCKQSRKLNSFDFNLDAGYNQREHNSKKKKNWKIKFQGLKFKPCYSKNHFSLIIPPERLVDKTLLGILLLPCGAVELNNMFGEFFFVRRTEIIDHSRVSRQGLFCVIEC